MSKYLCSMCTFANLTKSPKSLRTHVLCGDAELADTNYLPEKSVPAPNPVSQWDRIRPIQTIRSLHQGAIAVDVH
jgi:hypothetical protein